MSKVLLGSITASHRVMRDGCAVGYLYREAPSCRVDSGWRVFSGDESQAYADDASNFAMYNASTVIDVAPEIAPYLATNAPAAFERRRDGLFYAVLPPDQDD